MDVSKLKFLENSTKSLLLISHGLIQEIITLVDRIQVAVRAAASALKRRCGGDVEHQPGYRQMLIEMTVYLNAAVTAFDLRREVQPLVESPLRVVYGVYDLQSLRVRASPDKPGDDVRSVDGALAEAPAHAEDFADIAALLAERVATKGMLE